MMTSWNGHIFRVTGHLCGEFTGDRWIGSPVTGQRWFRYWLGALRQQATIWTNVDPDLCRHVVFLGHNELIFFLSFSHCFLNHFTPQYPQLASMPFHSTTIFTLAYLLPLSLAHLPQQKHYLNMLSSKTNALLTLASFWRKQSCLSLGHETMVCAVCPPMFMCSFLLSFAGTIPR